MEPGDGVPYLGLQAVGVTEVFVGDGGGLEGFEIGEHGGEEAVLVIDDAGEALAEGRGLVEVGDADAVDAANLVLIAWSDAAAGCAEVVGRGGGFFGETFFFNVIRQDWTWARSLMWRRPSTWTPCVDRRSTSLSRAGG